MNFEDRVSAYPNRYAMTDESGNVSYVFLERADDPITVGTPLNAETFNAMQSEITPIETGGTGAATPEVARKNLGVPRFVYGTIDVSLTTENTVNGFYEKSAYFDPPFSDTPMVNVNFIGPYQAGTYDLVISRITPNYVSVRVNKTTDAESVQVGYIAIGSY